MIQSRKIIFTLHRREDVMTIRQNSFIAGEMFSRRQMLEMGLPIGNPQLPPFNRKEMPFAPIAGAFAAVGAASGVLATTLAVANLVAISAMYVGVAMSVTGMITGDKGLMKIGAIVGLAGGIGSLAIGGAASLAAGGQFAMGTAGIESMNVANAAAANTANLAAHGAATGATLSTFTGQAAKDATNLTANMSHVTNTGGAINSFVGSAQAGTGVASPLIGNTGGSLLSSSQALGIGGGGAAGAAGGGFLSNLMNSMTPKDYLIGGGMAVQGASSMVQKGIDSEFGVKKAQLGLDKTAQDKELAAKQSEAANAYIQNLNQPTNLNVRNLSGMQG
jgi:hypothetical protein